MSLSKAASRLEAALGAALRLDESMSKHTTYRIGGPARFFIECDTMRELATALDILVEEGVEWTVVGKGSNLLVSDEGYEGAIVVLGREFAHWDFGGFDKQEDGPSAREPGETVLITAGAGNVLSRLVQKAFGLGLSGFEFAVGIPGTLGGALRMNAGSRDEWIGSIVDTVTTYAPGRGLKIIHGNEVAWGYRRSGLPSDEVILEASLVLGVADVAQMRTKMEESLARRKSTQPLGAPSCGSVFRNPDGDSAGRLITSCGLRGASCGGAQISEKHANFIVNNGSAKAADVLQLIHLAHDRVKENHGIELRPEVRFLGFPK